MLPQLPERDTEADAERWNHNNEQCDKFTLIEMKTIYTHKKKHHGNKQQWIE